MNIVFVLVVLQVIINNAIGVISTEKRSNDVNSSSTLIFERRTNTVVIKDANQVLGSYNIASLVGNLCDCKCKCCLQLSYLESCEHYCVCVENRTPVQQSCLGNLKFNPDIENCDLPGNFECIYKPTTSPPSTTTTPDESCKTEEGLYPHPGNCSLFIQCAHFQPNVHFCPPNLHFCESCDPPRCEYQSIANCTAEAGSKRDITRQARSVVTQEAALVVKSKNNGSKFKCPSKYGFYPVTGNPTSFYKCLDGVPTEELKCPLGLVYNPARSSCSKI